MQVVILERNKLVGRKVARLFVSVGATATTVEDPSAIDKSVQLQNLSTDTGSNSAVKSFTSVTTGFVTVDCKVKSAQTNVASQIDILGAGTRGRARVGVRAWASLRRRGAWGSALARRGRVSVAGCLLGWLLAARTGPGPATTEPHVTSTRFRHPRHRGLWRTAYVRA